MREKGSINEHELDVLLRDLSLEENSRVSNEKEAEFILGQNYHVSIDPKKEKELIRKLQNKSGGYSATKLFGLIFGISIIIALFLFLLINKDTFVYTESLTEQNKSTTNRELQSSTLVTETHPSEKNKAILKLRDTFGRPENRVFPYNTDSTVNTLKDPAIQTNENVKNEIPFLTEKDKLIYRSIKEQIIKTLITFNKDLYTKIPAYQTEYAGNSIVLDAYTIRNVSITNLEYKTFLADLLAQNKNEVYLICKITNENWTLHGYNDLANTYFLDEKYNDFPVVNISYEATKLFCKWLEDETKIYIQQHHLKNKNLQIRLPYDEEWIYAAREGYAKIAFEKGYNTIYDETAGLVNKSFTNRVELVKKRVKRIDTLYTYFTTNRYNWNEKQTLDFFDVGLNYYKTIPNDTIDAARMKVLGKIGHVSEIVPQKNTNRIWLSGLSWKTREDYQKLEQEFKNNSSSPFVGFRIVVVNPNDPEYKKPFW